MIKERELFIGDEYYKLRYGKDDKMSYYKIVIIDKTVIATNKYTYRYFIKGRSKKRDMHKQRIGSPRILAYKYTFYTSKLDMLVYLDANFTNFTSQIKEEIRKAKRINAEYFI